MTKRFYATIVSLAMITSLGSCRHAGPSGIWFFTYNSNPKELDSTGLNPSNFLVLQEDGHYTKDFGRFEYGQWKYSGDQLLLTDQNNEKSALTVNYLTAKEMQLGPAKGPLDNFERQLAGTGDDNENPFSLTNNRWRIRANAKENEQQIRMRLFNHFQFWERYFSWALKHKIDYIDVRSTPTLIKIYGNGFTLKPSDDLPPSWRRYFFDEADCLLANELVQKVFQSGNIAWPHTDNRFVLFISAFQQLEKAIKK